MTNKLEYVSPIQSPEKSRDVWRGSESEGLGFNLCVVPSRVIVSLILRDKDQVGGQRLEVGGQRLEVRGRRSEVRGRRLEVGGRRLEVGGRRLEVGGQRLEVRGDFVIKTKVG